MIPYWALFFSSLYINDIADYTNKLFSTYLLMTPLVSLPMIIISFFIKRIMNYIAYT